MRFLLVVGCLIALSEFSFVVSSGLSAILATEFVGRVLAKRLISDDNGRTSICSSDPEEEMTTPEIIRNSGYPAEEHFVTTEDGYILGLHRILGAPGSTAVLLHHGLMDSSFTWIALGKKRSLGYALADRGYDVWMANARGNIYSKNHTTLTPLDPEFWNFSYHEIGIYDVPAVIDYVRSVKNDGKKILYIGHSMGSTVFFVMASLRPDVGSKVGAMFGLAPAAYVDHVQGLGKLIEPPIRTVQEELDLDGRNELLPPNIVFRVFAKCVCNRPIYNDICLDLIFSLVGFNSKRFDKSKLTLILTHSPAGASVKTLFHYGLGIRSKKFRQYDYGPEKNWKLYKNATPPDYELGKVRVPTAFFWGENDFLTQPVDVKRLYDELPNKIEIYKVKDPDFNHLDFVWGADAWKLFHPRLFYLMDKYKSLN